MSQLVIAPILKDLRWGLVGFATALVGAGCVGLAEHFSSNILRVPGLVIVAVGLGVGGTAVLHGFLGGLLRALRKGP